MTIAVRTTARPEPVPASGNQVQAHVPELSPTHPDAAPIPAVVEDIRLTIQRLYLDAEAYLDLMEREPKFDAVQKAHVALRNTLKQVASRASELSV